VQRSSSRRLGDNPELCPLIPLEFYGALKLPHERHHELHARGVALAVALGSPIPPPRHVLSFRIVKETRYSVCISGLPVRFAFGIMAGTQHVECPKD
jgi:hypothetical protein